MSQEAGQRWWTLHLQVARGQILGAEDRAFYDSERKRIESQEMLGTPIAATGEDHARLSALQKQYAALEKQRQQLDAEIATLEAALGEQTRHLLQGKE